MTVMPNCVMLLMPDYVGMQPLCMQNLIGTAIRFWVKWAVC